MTNNNEESSALLGQYCIRPDPQVCRYAYKVASRIIRDMEEHSEIIKPFQEDKIPRFGREEIVLGNLLGKGGFNQVFEVHQVDISGYLPGFTKEDQERRRSQVAQEASHGRYAVKLLHSRTMENKEDYCNGAADLMMETMILANLEPHRNIIKLHGVSAAGAAGFAEGVEGGYFIIIDRLQETLTKRMQTWNVDGTPLQERVTVALELASALRHLHSYKIVFRDLKPDNIGFDVQGTLKLFDFGLAKELHPRDHYGDDTYIMTGQTGSRRYMAPEIVLEKPYGLSADVYAFGIVLWQICSLGVPFPNMSVQEHLGAVVMDKERPLIPPEWSIKLGNIMKWSWEHEPQVRPPMKEIYRALKTYLKGGTTNPNGKVPLPKVENLPNLNDLAPKKTTKYRGRHVSMNGAYCLQKQLEEEYELVSPLPFDRKNEKGSPNNKAADLKSVLSAVTRRRQPKTLVEILEEVSTLAQNTSFEPHETR